LKILIAEDEKISRIVLEASLKKRGHDVIAVENGLKAWEAFQQDYFPVMISDWMMPEMDGLALCRKIREHPHDNYTYLVLLTSLQGKTNYLEAMEAGAMIL
jgi:two-component system cell cycle response regulator